MQVNSLLLQFQHLFSPQKGLVLDLACGSGLNGLSLEKQSIDVLFADVNPKCLSHLREHHQVGHSACWLADFESTKLAADKLSHLQLQGIIVFKYLHRPLIKNIKQGIKPGGLVIYETFTEQNRQFGRPTRSDFLLRKGELKELFNDWEIIFYFEGIKKDPMRGVAQIVCRKPIA